MLNTQNGYKTYILFELAGTTYGIRSDIVQQMEMVERITPVPNTPAFVEGVVFSRGQVITAINLRLRFGFDKIPYDTRSRLIVVHTGSRTAGMIADTAREFVSIAAEAVQEPPAAISGVSGRYIEGIATLGERLVLILNVEELLSATETIAVMPAGGRADAGK
ncbi:MAG: chemotaxis protein CheW [Oscillatoria sp. Prado101]|jgi:purine-binding chemotaxis protein CheW|nr:chemotaxis protein CheW [Oscillatoria sp. Prado101]